MGHKAGKNGNQTSTEHSKNYNLTYLDASHPIGDTVENNADFIMNIRTFTKLMNTIAVPKVDLAQCWREASKDTLYRYDT